MLQAGWKIEVWCCGCAFGGCDVDVNVAVLALLCWMDCVVLLWGCVDEALLVYNSDYASCADVTLYIRVFGVFNNGIKRCDLVATVWCCFGCIIAARFWFGQNESGMGYCWIVIRLYVVISVASGLKNRSLMLCAGVLGVLMLMLMFILRHFHCCIEWIIYTVHWSSCCQHIQIYLDCALMCLSLNAIVTFALTWIL